MEIKQLVVGPLLTNCYILISNKEAVVIDPGAGLKKILKEIEGKKLKYIILTHYHWDHILGALKLKEKTGAKILISIF
jgi:hydroxyacylglutathione hydrolase